MRPHEWGAETAVALPNSAEEEYRPLDHGFSNLSNSVGVTKSALSGDYSVTLGGADAEMLLEWTRTAVFGTGGARSLSLHIQRDDTLWLVAAPTNRSNPDRGVGLPLSPASESVRAVDCFDSEMCGTVTTSLSLAWGRLVQFGTGSRPGCLRVLWQLDPRPAICLTWLPVSTDYQVHLAGQFVDADRVSPEELTTVQVADHGERVIR